MVLRDLIERHDVSNPLALRWMQRHLLANPAEKFSGQKFYDALRSQGIPVGKDTLHAYLAHLEDTFLIRTASLHTASERRRHRPWLVAGVLDEFQEIEAITDRGGAFMRNILGPVLLPLEGIHWVIAGGESGPKRHRMEMDWARSVRDQSQAGGVPFFFKQVGGRTPKAGGRFMDGRTWDEMPTGRGSAPRGTGGLTAWRVTAPSPTADRCNGAPPARTCGQGDPC